METCTYQTLRLFSSGHLVIITILVASVLFAASADVFTVNLISTEILCTKTVHNSNADNLTTARWNKDN